MCGIAGILDSESSAESLEAKGRQMMHSLLHRGPDEGGLWRSESCNLVLLHRRLSIQDLSASGAQPMLSGSRRYCVAFNGEIYNFKEIATELVGKGYSFRGHSDTEVLLAAIDEWGLETAIGKFVGMFAFALWDREQKIIHLCRDRLGEKPLYYGCFGNAFYFASELKAIEAVVPGQFIQVDQQALSGYLKNGYISAPLSIYHGVYKLMPGTVLSIPVGKKQCAGHNILEKFSPWNDREELSPKTYWSVTGSASQGMSDPIQDEGEAIEALDAELHRSIRRQLIADVKIGTFLSGGIDSSVVSAIAQKESGERIKTYTIGFSEKEYDESGYAETIAKHLGTEHLTMHVGSNDALNVVPDLASIYDEPFADSSQIPTYLVSRLAREHVTVCLSGDGGDELFAGYNRYLWTQSLWKKLSPVPYPLRKFIGKALAVPSPRLWDGIYNLLSGKRANSYDRQKLVGLKVQKLAGFIQQKDVFKAYDYLMSYWHHPDALVRDMSDKHNKSAPDYAAGLDLSLCDGFVDQAMLMDQSIYLPGDNLAKVDRASMAVSLETRLPLLSHEVVDLAWRIPVSMKVKNNVSKWALRQVLYKYVPQKMIDRPKMGFSVPVAKWLRDDLKDWAGDLICGIDMADGLLDKKPIERAWLEHVSGKRDHSHRLWTVLMYLSWIQQRSH